MRIKYMALLTVAAVMCSLSTGAMAQNTLNYGQTATLGNLSPFFLSPAHAVINNTAFDGLTRYDEDLVPQPRLATSWEFSEDGTKLTLKLREGVEFHDGAPFTSSDVAETVKYVQDPINGALIQGFAKRVISVEAPDEMTVVLGFEQPFPGVFDLLELMFIIDAKTAGDFSSSANGTGPFKVVSHEPGGNTVFVRNDDYWDGPPSLDRVEIKTIPNLQAELLALRSGDVDFVDNLGFIDLAPFRRDANFQSGAVPASTGHDISINIRSGPLQNPAVREAIDLALDRERMSNLLYGDLGSTWCLPFGPNSLAYVKEYDNCEYDIDKAKSVLEGAGVELPLSLRLMTSTEISSAYTTIAEILQQDLEKIGINVEIENFDQLTYRSRYLTDYDYDIASHGFGRAGKDPSSLLETTVVFKPEGNVSGFSDEAYTAAVTEGGSSTDNDVRAKAYGEATRILRTSRHILTVAARPRLFAVSSDIEGLNYSADGYPILQGISKSE